MDDIIWHFCAFVCVRCQLADLCSGDMTSLHAVHVFALSQTICRPIIVVSDNANITDGSLRCPVSNSVLLSRIANLSACLMRNNYRIWYDALYNLRQRRNTTGSTDIPTSGKQTQIVLTVTDRIRIDVSVRLFGWLLGVQQHFQHKQAISCHRSMKKIMSGRVTRHIHN